MPQNKTTPKNNREGRRERKGPREKKEETDRGREGKKGREWISCRLGKSFTGRAFSLSQSGCGSVRTPGCTGPSSLLTLTALAGGLAATLPTRGRPSLGTCGADSIEPPAALASEGALHLPAKKLWRQLYKDFCFYLLFSSSPLRDRPRLAYNSHCSRRQY